MCVFCSPLSTSGLSSGTSASAQMVRQAQEHALVSAEKSVPLAVGSAVIPGGPSAVLSPRDLQPLGAGETDFLSDPQKAGVENLLPKEARGRFPAARLLLHNAIVLLTRRPRRGPRLFQSKAKKYSKIVFPVRSSVT